jgi:pimeloyl-ACP methyl ester carboxylesterase
MTAEISSITHPQGHESWYRRVTGEGAPCLFLHGMGGNSLPLRRFATAFEARGRPTVLLDLRGHGLSGVPADAAWTIEEYAADVIGVLDGLGVGRAHIVGHCLGGMVALKVCELRPDVAERLVLISTSGDPHGNASAPGVRRAVQTADRVLSAAAPGMHRARVIAQNDPTLFPRHPDVYIPRLIADVRHTSSATILRTLQSILGADLRQAAAGIRARSYIVHGRRDVFIPHRAAEELGALLADSKVEMRENDGHVSHVLDRTSDLPERVYRFVTEE